MDDLSAVRVLVVDNSAPWRHFVAAQLLERSVPVVGMAVDWPDALEKTRALQPDVIILDIWMPGLNGVAGARKICTLAPASRLLIVSDEGDPAIVHAAFTAGARGYALKSLAPIDLLKAIEAIVRGDLFIGRGLAGGESDDG